MQDKREIIQSLFELDEKDKEKSFSYTKYAYFLIVAGIILLFTSYGGYTGNMYIIAGAMIVIGLFLIRKKLNSLFDFSEYEIPNDEKIKQYFNDDIEKSVLSKAFSLHGINVSKINQYDIIKIFIPQPLEEKDVMRLSDGSVMTSRWKVILFFFGKYSLFYYECLYNWIEDTLSNDISNEFFYENTASIKTENKEINSGINNDKLIISNVSGDKIECDLPDDTINIPSDFKINVEMLLGKMRKIIREKRYGKDSEITENDIDFEIIDRRNEE